MKTKLIILIFCLGFLNYALGQVLTDREDQSPQELYDFHIKKKKANVIAGLIVVGAGTAMLIGGIYTHLNYCLLSSGGCYDGLATAFSGIGVALSSLVFLDKAWKHEKKAKIQLQNGAVGLNNKIKYSGISIVYSF